MPVTRCNQRVVEAVPYVPPHAMFATLPEGTVRELQEALVEASSSGQLPRVYTKHPIIKGKTPDGYEHIPLTLYRDGLESTKKESRIGVTVSAIASKSKHLVFVLRCTES
eukprot:4110298-Amphidinium_carterae.1